MVQLVMSVVADDRPGVISKLSAVLLEMRGERVASELARFGGKLGGLVLVDVPEPKAFEARIKAVAVEAGIGLEVFEAGRIPDLNNLVHVEISGKDKPNILGSILDRFEQMGVRLDSLRNVQFPQADTVSALFVADMVLELEPGTDPSALHDAIEDVVEVLTFEVVTGD